MRFIISDFIVHLLEPIEVSSLDILLTFSSVALQKKVSQSWFFLTLWANMSLNVLKINLKIVFQMTWLENKTQILIKKLIFAVCVVCCVLWKEAQHKITAWGSHPLSFFPGYHWDAKSIRVDVE